MSSHITELEEKLRRAEKLAYVGQMTSKLAHELRNPLNTISINLQMLEEDIATAKNQMITPIKRLDYTDIQQSAICNPQFADQFLRRVQISRHEIQRLEHLLSNFLRFAKSIPAEIHPTDINKLIQHLIEFINPTAKAAQVEIIAELEPELPRVNLDEKLMKSALLNLVLNAIEAMPNGGTVTLQTAVTGKSKKQVLLVIQDTGTGIPQENLTKVFDVFYTTKEDGSGLGLSIAKRIITDIDGTIGISSVLGKGTTVTITLPGS
jgi:signal transduction histidine kinase